MGLPREGFRVVFPGLLREWADLMNFVLKDASRNLRSPFQSKYWKVKLRSTTAQPIARYCGLKNLRFLILRMKIQKLLLISQNLERKDQLTIVMQHIWIQTIDLGFV